MTQAKIEPPINEIAEFCRRHRIREMALFGSVLRDDFGPDSDVDVLIEFEPNAGIGYMRFFRLQDELTELFGRDIDLFTPDSLRRFARETVMQTKAVVYAA
jgi:predicted nucleotidyltransferase